MEKENHNFRAKWWKIILVALLGFWVGVILLLVL